MIDFEKILIDAKNDLSAVKDSKGLFDIRVKYLGKKSVTTELLKQIGSVPPEERAEFGKRVNILKSQLETVLNDKNTEISKLEIQKATKAGGFDITLPGKAFPRGKRHPITQIMDELISIFEKLGFSVAEGPDIETEYYNFEALNIPPYHPSRDMWSTLWLEDGLLLRTHTSPVQIRVMEKEQPPIAVIAPGRVYRRDADITHSPVFHQLEGLLVDCDVKFSDLKGILTLFLHSVFGKDKKVRFRPSYFPFTEPSAEVDVECVMCNGHGCKVCKNTGWLEILGSGMVDPNVFKYVHYDTEKYTGFAFGVGVERIAMLKYGIDDIRLFFENDIRFLRQF